MKSKQSRAGKPALYYKGGPMNDKFYDWLARKYGWGEETFAELDEDFQEDLIAEFCSIAASYGN